MRYEIKKDNEFRQECCIRNGRDDTAFRNMGMVQNEDCLSLHTKLKLLKNIVLSVLSYRLWFLNCIGVKEERGESFGSGCLGKIIKIRQ